MEAESAMLLDPDTLDKTKHYRFIQERRENLARRRAQGYELVLRSEHGVRLLSEALADESADDLIRVGDAVLMMCDKNLFKERRNRLSRLATDRLGATEQSFQEGAKRKGVRSLTGEEGE